MIFHAAILIALIIIINGYFKIATRYQIIDEPNSRSSHSYSIIRGGGIVIPIAVLIYAFYAHTLSYFMVGLFLISVVSFLDDLIVLANRWRILIQLVSVLLLLFEVTHFQSSLLLNIIAVVLVIGSINAVNFMDGINGITVMYALVMLLSFGYLNYVGKFVDTELLSLSGLGVLVFGFYNFRNKAVCFAGDVGSISLGYLLVFVTLLYIQSTGNIAIILLWAVYGIDTIVTIVYRIARKENIFKAHRSHFYQYMVNEGKASHLAVASGYGIAQVVINLIFFANLKFEFFDQVSFLVYTLLISGLLYVIAREGLLRKLRLENK